MSPEGDQRPMSPDAALQHILALQHRIEQEGAVDSERDQFDAIRKALMEGRMTPEQAIAMAETIVRERQNYH